MYANVGEIVLFVAIKDERTLLFDVVGSSEAPTVKRPQSVTKSSLKSA